MMLSSTNMLQGIEYMNWYQVIRPIGFAVNEKSRVEILKVADESDLRLRDNVPWGLKEKTRDSMVKDTELQNLASNHLNSQLQTGPECLDATANSKMYLSPKLQNFQDQDKEIENIFWELLKSVRPKCPDDVDLLKIRNILAERQATLGRDKKELSEEDLFHRYSLGINVGRTPEKQSDTAKQDNLRPRDELLEMIDKMATERMKPEEKRNDMFDKNTPIRGKVAFRRDETGEGPKYYTDLDEVLSFGDLENDLDSRKFMVQQKKGMYDSEGNFIPGKYDPQGKFIKGIFDAKGDFIPGRYDEKGNFIPGRYDDKGNFIPGKYDYVTGAFIPGDFDMEGNFIRRHEEDSDDSLDEDRRKNKKIKKKGGQDSESYGEKGKLDAKTEAERLETLRKALRHPAIDFPLCNYPKWVHRMYRMDQVKIGQLVKQGMGVPEYTPPWMLNTLDRVWRGKDPRFRGGMPSQEKSQFGESSPSKKLGAKGVADRPDRPDKMNKKGTQKITEGEDENQGKESGNGGGEAEGLARGLQTGGGLADFLRGYEKEMVDLGRLDSDKETLNKKGDTSFGMDDLIEQYHEELLRAENINKHDREKFHKKSLEEKARKSKERQEAALKRIHDKEKKIKQEQEIKKMGKSGKDSILEEKQEKMAKKTQEFGLGDALKRKGKGKGRDVADKKTVGTDPCKEFKTTNLDKAKDEECRKRFQILLGGKKSRFLGGTDFAALAKQIELIKYSRSPSKKTPCERAKIPICR